MRIEREFIDWEKIMAIHISDKDMWNYLEKNQVMWNYLGNISIAYSSIMKSQTAQPERRFEGTLYLVFRLPRTINSINH